MLAAEAYPENVTFGLQKLYRQQKAGQDPTAELSALQPGVQANAVPGRTLHSTDQPELDLSAGIVPGSNMPSADPANTGLMQALLLGAHQGETSQVTMNLVSALLESASCYIVVDLNDWHMHSVAHQHCAFL